MSICADLGRCAYAAADDLYGDGTEAEGCPWWSDCFGPVPIGDGHHDSALADDRDRAQDVTVVAERRAQP